MKTKGKVLKLTTVGALFCGLLAMGVSKPTASLARVNPAVEDRSNPQWQKARLEVLETRPESSNTLGPIHRGNPRDKELALTFDDGPHGATTVQLLNILRSEHVPATFFVIGKMAQLHPEDVKMEVADGDEVGNHTFSHVTLTKIPPAEAETEYEACSDVVQQITGQRPKFCRPPGGDWNEDVVKAASKLGMSTVLWTDDPGDYNDPGDPIIERRTLRTASNGGIILLHDGSSQTLQILPNLISNLKERGYKFVTMSQLAKDKRLAGVRL